MASLDEMRRLGREMVCGLDQRLDYLTGLRKEIDGFRGAWRQERAVLAGELQEELFRDKARREGDVASALQRFGQERQEAGREMQAELADFHGELAEKVAEMVGFFGQERQCVAQDLQELARGHEQRGVDVTNLLNQFNSARGELEARLAELRQIWQEVGRALLERRH